MSSFPNTEEFDFYLTMQKKGEAAITWEELPSNKIYRVTPAAVEVNSGFLYKLMDVVDAENQKISVWTPTDIYDRLIKYGLDSYFRTLAPKTASRGGKRKSTTYESVLLTNSGKRRCLVHSRTESFEKEIRKAFRRNFEKGSKIAAAKKKKKEQEGILNHENPAEKTEEKKID